MKTIIFLILNFTLIFAKADQSSLIAEMQMASNKFGGLNQFNASTCGVSYPKCGSDASLVGFAESAGALIRDRQMEPVNSRQQTNELQVSGIGNELLKSNDQTQIIKQLPVVLSNEEILDFSVDKNPVLEVQELGCISGEVPTISKCYPSVLEGLRSGKVTVTELSKRQPFRFEIKDPSKEVNDATTFEFHHNNFAKQDVGLTIYHGFHNSEKRDSLATELVFIPRKRIPAYEVKGNQIEVTLANNEKMMFDLKTGKLISGVVKNFRQKDYTYGGSGIMIKTSGIDGHGKSHLETANQATIYKEGKSCIVKTSELWSKPSQKKAGHFKFVNDADFYRWLDAKKNCFK